MTTSDLELLGLESFDLTPDRGFLPESDPRVELPPRYAAWQELAAELPGRLLAARVRDAIHALPLLDASALEPGDTLRCAMRVLSFLAHAYVWQGPARNTGSRTS